MLLGNCGGGRDNVEKLPSTAGRYSGGSSVVREGVLVGNGVKVLVAVDFGVEGVFGIGEA
jgi:hypothetical protein